MLGLLVLSLTLSTSASASAEAQVIPADPSLGAEQPFVLVHPDGPMQKFDSMEIQPEGDVCYKIRAYVFTKDANPKFLRETTCGPKATLTRKKVGYRPLTVLERDDKPSGPATK
jgi:hypothetical protein